MDILKISDGRDLLYQWDVGRTAEVLTECNKVQFATYVFGKSIKESALVEVKNGTVDIPNILLQSSGDIYCWAIVRDKDGDYADCHQKLQVLPRAKPSDYVYTETEVKSYEALGNRIEVLEKNGTSNAVLYVEQSLTDEQKEQARINISALGTDDLPNAVNAALTEAKESGVFDGKDGYTPIKGKDYFDGENGSDYVLTDDDKHEIASMVEVQGGSGIDVTAEVGQTIVVKEVDGDGKPTAWEAVDLPSEGLSNQPWELIDRVEVTTEGVTQFKSTTPLREFKLTVTVPAVETASAGACEVYKGNKVWAGYQYLGALLDKNNTFTVIDSVSEHGESCVRARSKTYSSELQRVQTIGVAMSGAYTDLNDPYTLITVYSSAENFPIGTVFELQGVR